MPCVNDKSSHSIQGVVPIINIRSSRNSIKGALNSLLIQLLKSGSFQLGPCLTDSSVWLLRFAGCACVRVCVCACACVSAPAIISDYLNFVRAWTSLVPLSPALPNRSRGQAECGKGRRPAGDRQLRSLATSMFEAYIFCHYTDVRTYPVYPW